MALDAYVTSFNITTAAAGNTVVITPNFQTKCGIAFWSGRTSSTDGNGAGTHLRGHGFFCATAGSPGNAGACSRSADAQGNAIADHGHREDACIVEQGDGALVGWAGVTAISSTQVTFTIGDAFTTDLRCTVICLGGSDITGVEISRFTATGTAPVSQSVTFAGALSGVTPNTVFLLAGTTTNPPDVALDSRAGFGVANASGMFAWAGGSNESSANMVTESSLRSGEILTAFSVPVTAVDNRADGFTPTAGGFDFTWQARGLAQRIYYLALAGTFQSTIGSFLTLTNTTTDITGSTSFTPKAMFFVSHTKAQNSAGGLSAHDKWSFGVATGTSAQHCQAIADRDANTTSFVSMALEQDHIYVNMDEVNQTLQGSANLTAVGASGFTARMTDADPAQASVCWLALGDAPAAGGGFRSRIAGGSVVTG